MGKKTTPSAVKVEKKTYTIVREGHDPFNGIVQLLSNENTWKVNSRKGSSPVLRTEVAAAQAFDMAIADGQF